MSKEKTPIQELIEELEEGRYAVNDDIYLATMEIVIDTVKGYRPKEREAIKEAYDSGYDDHYLHEIDVDYYTEKYGK